MATRGEPTQRLATDAYGLFLIRSLIWTVPLFIGTLIVGGEIGSYDEIDEYRLPFTVAGVLIAVFGATVAPWLRTRHWRYELRKDELEIQHGTLSVTRTVIPISRIQHVDIERTPTSSLLDLVELGIHTAGESHGIPALDEAVAAKLRDTIADQLHEPDEL